MPAITLRSLKEKDGDFITDLMIRLHKARASFPGNKNRLAALVEEVGEVGTVLERNEGPERLYDECLDVAVTALRLAVEGDSSQFNTVPSMMIGNFRLTRMAGDRFWIEHPFGEAGAFPAKPIEDLIAKHFTENF